MHNMCIKHCTTRTSVCVQHVHKVVDGHALLVCTEHPVFPRISLTMGNLQCSSFTARGTPRHAYKHASHPL